jgi:hypothetical protein
MLRAMCGQLLRRSTLLLVLGLFADGAARADSTLTFDGDAPEGGADHFYIPFDVPPGVRELEVRHENRTPGNTLDFGLLDPGGPIGYRGWGGGSSESAIVGELAASRAYVPGPLTPGSWRVVIGKAQLLQLPARYHVEVVLRDKPTLPPQNERRPYSAAPPLLTGRRYYAGDLHVHSQESTDARPDLSQIVRFAAGRHLDFVEISDHNTVTQLEFFSAAQAQSSSVLLLPGIEVTTYAGHMNAIGATRFVEHKIGQPGVTIDTTADAVSSQGALLSINHPVLDLGAACIGCAWKQPLDGSRINAVEIGTGGLAQGSLFFVPRAIAFWEALLARGHHVAAVGGSDDHRGGLGTGAMDSPIGDPTTLVLCDELSAAAIVDGIRRGRTVVKLQGPDDPMIDFGEQDGGAAPGDTLRVRSTMLVARVTAGMGASVRFVKNGEPQSETVIDADPFVLRQPVSPPEGGAQERWRVEVLLDNLPRTLVSPIYVEYDPAGRDALAEPAMTTGCRVAAVAVGRPSGDARAALLYALILLGLLRCARGRVCATAFRPASRALPKP